MEGSVDTGDVRTPKAGDQGFAELSVVSLRHSVKDGERSIPAGTKATIVAAYRDGLGYEIEVFAPFHAVVTVESDDLVA